VKFESAPADFILEILDLQDDQLRRRADAAEACFIYRAAGEPSLCAASLSVLVASCSTLLDSASSRAHWLAAAKQYADIGHPYAEILAVCAGDSRRAPPADELRSPLALQCRLLRLAWLAITAPGQADFCRQELDEIRPGANRLQAERPGQLALPVGHTRDLAQSLVSDWRDAGLTAAVSSSIRRILRISADTVRAAQSDRLHWRRILPGFMPVEPEWLAVGRIAYEVITLAGLDEDVISPGLGELELLPLQIAAGLPPPSAGSGDDVFPPWPPLSPAGEALDSDAARSDGIV
jgi:hypothetical protein